MSGEEFVAACERDGLLQLSPPERARLVEFAQQQIRCGQPGGLLIPAQRG